MAIQDEERVLTGHQLITKRLCPYCGHVLVLLKMLNLRCEQELQIDNAASAKQQIELTPELQAIEDGVPFLVITDLSVTQKSTSTTAKIYPYFASLVVHSLYPAGKQHEADAFITGNDKLRALNGHAFLMTAAESDEIYDRQKGLLAGLLVMLSDFVGKGPYCFGATQPTMVDLALAPLCYRLEAIKPYVDMLVDLDDLQAWSERLREQDYVKQGLLGYEDEFAKVLTSNPGWVIQDKSSSPAIGFSA